MSRTFKLSFDQQVSISNERNNSEREGAALQNQQYEQESYSRNICFVKDDDSRMFLSYSHLLSGKYEPEENTIVLTFTTHTVKMKGKGFLELFYQLKSQLIKQLVCVDSRYSTLEDQNAILVFEMLIVPKE